MSDRATREPTNAAQRVGHPTVRGVPKADGAGDGRAEGNAGGAGVARNALYLVLGQVATAALSFGITALLARRLGAEGYGILYLATVFAQSAFIAVDLGQEYYVVRVVARHRERVATLLGTGLALRIVATLAVYLPAMGVARLLGYSEATRTAIALMLIFQLFDSLGKGFSVIFRGLERMEYDAVSRVVMKALIAAAVVVAVALHGDLVMIIEAQIVGAAASLVLYVLMLRRLGAPRPAMHLHTAISILRGGVPFLLWSVTVALEDVLDAVMLSKLAPGTVLGWYGAAQRLTGVLIFPATILGAALYPTLARLYVEQPSSYRDFVRSSLRFMLLLGALTAAGTYFFADKAILFVYGPQAFSHSATNLRAQTPCIFMVFINVTLGTAIMAANRQTRLVYAKAACIPLFLVLSALFIPLAQAGLGNGGVGSSVAMAASEAVMLGVVFLLTPGGTLVPELFRGLARAGAAVAGMAGVIWLLGDTFVGVVIVAAVLTYVTVVALLGGIAKEEITLFSDAVRRRVASGVTAPSELLSGRERTP